MPPKSTKPEPAANESAAKTGDLTDEAVIRLTLLTFDQLKKLVHDGYIPAPKKGFYAGTQAIRGAFRWYREQIDKPLTVNKDELREITGLSDQRHRQLANEGQFPAPIKGRYQLRAVCAGIIRYFRDLHARRDKEIGALRKEKLQLEIDSLAREKARDEGRFIAIEEMLNRLIPATAAAKQIILGSSLLDEEKEQILQNIQAIFANAGADHEKPIIPDE